MVHMSPNHTIRPQMSSMDPTKDLTEMCLGTDREGSGWSDLP